MQSPKHFRNSQLPMQLQLQSVFLRSALLNKAKKNISLCWHQQDASTIGKELQLHKY
jgi:hypothetical protein